MAQSPDDASGPRGAYVYRVGQQKNEDGDETDPMLLALGAGTSSGAIPVSREWLDLFPRGADLDYSTLRPGRARRAPGVRRRLDPRARRGSATCWPPTSGTVLLIEDGPAVLDPFAAAVYEHLATPTGFHPPLPAPRLPRP